MSDLSRVWKHRLTAETVSNISFQETDKIILTLLTGVVLHNSMKLEKVFDNKNKGQENRRKKCLRFASKKHKCIMCQISRVTG